MHMLFLSGTKGGIFRILCFYKLSIYFSETTCSCTFYYGVIFILIAIHKGLLQPVHPSTETLTH